MNRNIDHNPIKFSYDGSEISQEDVAKGILLAGYNTEWTMTQMKDNQIEATLLVRNKHLVKVDITFTQNHFNIRYNNSDNMDVDGNNIHPNYFIWIKQLVKDINLYLATV